MRNTFYFLAALLAFGAAYYYYQDVSAQTATVTKLRLVDRDNLVIEAGTVIDEEFMREYVVVQPLPRTLAEKFGWALDNNTPTRINLEGRVFGQDVPAGSFLQRAHFFVPQENAFARRIAPGNRAFSIAVESNRAVENFILPGARVDVIGTFETADGGYQSRRLLENVEVMAVGKYDSRGEFNAEGKPGYNSVTLQTVAADVEQYLSDAEAAEGALTLVLRNPCENPGDCAAEASQ